jgi:signal transduction histidine kinase
VQQGGSLPDIRPDSNTLAVTRRPAWPGYLVAVIAVALSFSLRLALRPALDDAAPFLLFTPAVAIGAIYGGVGPGVFATILSTLLGSHFFLIASAGPVIEKWDRVILFMIVGGVITISTSLLQRSRQQLAASLWREQQARAAAEAADRAKDDFLAAISHELRTPMSVILGWLSAIQQQRLKNDALHHALDAVDRNAKMLSRLIDDVLDRSRIATGTLRLELQRISLIAVVQAAVDQMRARIAAADLLLHVSLPDADLAVRGDAIRLQQVLTNLLANAMKFTPKGGHISVKVVATHDTARVIVADTGVGITPDLLPHIFDPFRQGAETLANSHQGLGLGLAIARYLIQQHGGTIIVASDGPGRGATFTVTLPLAEQSHRWNSGFEPGSGETVDRPQALH